MIWFVSATLLILGAIWLVRRSQRPPTFDKKIAQLNREITKLKAEQAFLDNTPEARERAWAESVGKDLVLRHPNIVSTFVEIAYRSVSVKDEYGDENVRALRPEIERCVDKLAIASGGFTKYAKIGAQQVFGVYVGGIDERPVLAMLLAIAAESELKKKFFDYYEQRLLEDVNIANLNQMTGVEFETYIMGLLSAAGYDVQGTSVTGDRGADIIARKASAKIVIQAKRSSAPVGLGAVQEVVAALRVYGGTEGWVVSNSSFTAAARELAQHNSVRLVSGNELPSLSKA